MVQYSTRQLGSMLIRVHPFPTPDPAKCGELDNIGVFTRGSIDRKDTLDYVTDQITEFHAMGSGWFLSRQGAWSMPHRFGRGPHDYKTKERSWVPWVDPIGWFWTRNAASLPCREIDPGSSYRGAWRLEGAFGPWTITATGSRSFRILSLAPTFDTLEEAQVHVAWVDRHMNTKREP